MVSLLACIMLTAWLGKEIIFILQFSVFLLGVSREMLQAHFAIFAPNTFLDQIHAV